VQTARRCVLGAIGCVRKWMFVGVEERGTRILRWAWASCDAGLL
jgi:hypothetical protein